MPKSGFDRDSTNHTEVLSDTEVLRFLGGSDFCHRQPCNTDCESCIKAATKTQSARRKWDRYELQPEYEAMLAAGKKHECDRCRSLWEKDHDYFRKAEVRRATAKSDKAMLARLEKARAARAAKRAQAQAAVLKRTNERLGRA